MDCDVKNAGAGISKPSFRSNSSLFSKVVNRTLIGWTVSAFLKTSSAAILVTGMGSHRSVTPAKIQS